MGKNSKKIVLVFLIIALIVIGVVSTLFILIKNETIAITKEQKINKGIKEISKNVEQTITNNKIEQSLEIINSKISRNTTTITAQVNEFDMKYFAGYTEIIDEIKEMINKAQIQNVIERDFDNKYINQKFSLKVGNVINSLTEEIIFNENEIGIKMDELNNKYLLIENQNNELFSELGNVFEEIEKPYSIDGMKLTDYEKNYFIDNYKEIITNSITSDMIEENTTTININGREVKCSEIYVSLNKIQITNILTQIIQKLENDEQGKAIVSSKLEALNKTYSEIDIDNLLYALKTELVHIDSNANIKIKMYCDYKKTYGFTFDINTGTEQFTINNLFEDNYNYIELKTKEASISVVLASDVLKINLNTKYLKNNINFVYDETNGIGEGVLNIIGNEDNGSIKIVVNTNFSRVDDITIKCRVQYNDNNNNIDITFNIQNVIENANSITKKQFNNTNSIDIISASEEEKQEYIDTVFNNIDKLLKNAANNSKLLGIYYRYYSNDISEALKNAKEGANQINNVNNTIQSEAESITESTTDLATTQAMQAFNREFSSYEGEQKGSRVKVLYQVVQTTNASITNGHIVIWNSNYNFDEIENSKVYMVTLEYGNDGYINKITVK